MTTLEFKLATVMAKDTSISLPGELADGLIGCGLPEFEPVSVSMRSVASLLRWQCLCLDGSWDETEYQNMRAICVRKRRIEISDLTEIDVREWVHLTMERVLKS